MATVRGFRGVAHDYSSLYRPVEPAGLVTGPAPDTVTHEAGIYFAANPALVAFYVTYPSAGALGEYERLLLVEADDGDLISTGGSGALALFYGGDRLVRPVTAGDYGGDWVYADDASAVPAGDRPLSRRFYVASTVTVVDETSLPHKADLTNKSRRADVAAVAAILATYGWDDWEPARI